MDDNVDGIVAEFYEHQLNYSEIALVIGDAETLQRLKKSMRRYILELFEGYYDADYVNTRLRIGKIHQRIGVSPKLYVAGLSKLKQLLNDLIKKHKGPAEDCSECQYALQKLLMFDMQLVFDTYIATLIAEVDSAHLELKIYAESLEETVATRTAQLRELSTRDDLTGLFNQRAMYDILRRELAACERSREPLTLVYFDLNGFKQLNDSHGHREGDRQLASIGQTVLAHIREMDSACRSGGDEFCIILPRSEISTGRQVYERMLKAFDALLAKFAIGDSEVALIRAAGNLLREDIPEIVGEFYDWLIKQDEFSIFFSDDVRSLERVKALQTDFWNAFFEDALDDQYFASRRHIGAVHAHIELPNDVYCASMSTMHGLIKAKLRSKAQPGEFHEIEEAVTKLILLDTYLVLDEIAQIKNEKINVHSQSLQELSTPVTPIWEGILLLPLLGIMDSSRTQDIMQKTLAKIGETRAKIFVIDISGVAAVDTAVANQLIKITKATQLMGCESIISGISPSISQTLVELGINVGEVKTTATLRDALEVGLRSLGDLRFLPGHSPA